MALLVLLFATGVYFLFFSRTDEFYLSKYANADAKFYGDHLITSVDEKIRVLDLQGNLLKTYDDLKASWIYVYEEEGLIIYSNHDYEIHLLKLDEQMDIVYDRVIFRTELLAIDPTVCKVEDTYLVSYTTIEGTINNPEPDGDNGRYTLELFASEDLENWEYRTAIVSEKQDIEDIDMLYDEGVLYCIYEKEDYDKGPSEICVKASEDAGVTWSEETVLIENTADNEPACILKTENGYRLYYSSDYACVGESYNGASAYYADLSRSFEVLSSYVRVDMKDNYGVRLYEVKELDGRLYLMFAHNFMTDKDFVLRSIKAN
ncbi:MAG: hypothetical protein ACI4DV_01545 [Lachnospiraceae bacterium]